MSCTPSTARTRLPTSCSSAVSNSPVESQDRSPAQGVPPHPDVANGAGGSCTARAVIDCYMGIQSSKVEPLARKASAWHPIHLLPKT
eukprot:9137181-Pyramimonas_sp.AAC.1